MNDDIWQAKRRIETDYSRSLQRLIHRAWQMVGDECSELDITECIRKIGRSKLLTDYAFAASRRMVTQTFADTARIWRRAAKKGSQGRMIYEALRNDLEGPLGGTVNALILRNAQLIKSMPDDIADRVSLHVQSKAFEGKRPEEIAKAVRKLFPDATEVQARLIARTEASKAHTTLIQARAERLGLKWYIWRTSKDGRVRESHDLMDGVLCRFDTPPAPELLVGEKSLGHYNAGEIFNCRCYPEPLIDIDDVSWPMKVHYGGKIVRMSKAEFKKVA